MDEWSAPNRRGGCQHLSCISEPRSVNCRLLRLRLIPLPIGQVTSWLRGSG